MNALSFWDWPRLDRVGCAPDVDAKINREWVLDLPRRKCARCEAVHTLLLLAGYISDVSKDFLTWFASPTYIGLECI